MSLRDAIAGVKHGQEAAESTAVAGLSAPVRKPRRELAAAKPRPEKKTATGIAKSTNPEYVQLKVYVPGATRRKAVRKWEDEGGRDMSDLIEKLLIEYLRT